MPPSDRQTGAPVGIGQQPEQGIRQGVRITRCHHAAGYPVLDQFADRREIPAHHAYPGGHGLHEHNRYAVPVTLPVHLAGQHEQVGAAQELAHLGVGAGAQQFDAGAETEAGALGGEALQLRSVARDADAK